MSNEDRCSFCGKRRDQVGTLVAGQKLGEQRAFICDACVALLAAPGDAYVSPPDPTLTWPPMKGRD
jgi:hypothetical protein